MYNIVILATTLFLEQPILKQRQPQDVFLRLTLCIIYFLEKDAHIGKNVVGGG